MDLYNDFTYFLENPGYGDQFHQKDRRIITGVKASYTLLGKLLGGDMDNTFGLQLRNDNAPTVGLFSVNEDQWVQTAVDDHVVDDQPRSSMRRIASSGSRSCGRCSACAGNSLTGT